MLLRRQSPDETSAAAPTGGSYGQIYCDLDGRIYVTNKNGQNVSLCSTAEKLKGFTFGRDVPKNAAFIDTTYDIREGNTNGAFQVNWKQTGETTSSGSYVVKIHGLDTMAYQSSTNYVTTSSLSSSLANRNSSTTINATALGGSSLQDILDYVDKKTGSSTNPFA